MTSRYIHQKEKPKWFSSYSYLQTDTLFLLLGASLYLKILN